MMIVSLTVSVWGQDATEEPGYFHQTGLDERLGASVPAPFSLPGGLERPEIPPLASDPEVGIKPLTATLAMKLEPRELTLREAVRIALLKSDVVRSLGSGGVQTESATGYDAEIQQIQAHQATTVFDPKVTAGYLGSRINEPVGTFFGPGITQITRRDEGNFIASVTKTWQTGATTTIGYLPPLGYLFYPNGNAGQFNPVYTSDMVMQATQPLLKGAGTNVNLAPIRIAQLQAEQSAWDCKQAVMAQVRSVETAYWDLQASIISMNAMESILSLMSEIVRIENQREKSEHSIKADVARVTIQLDAFQQQRFQARNDVVAKELRLRNLMAIGITDGIRLMPVDTPRLALEKLDLANAVASATEMRPDLVRQRLGVRIRELQYMVADNGTKPQLDLQALYRSNGIGQQLNTSLQQMMGFQYSDWTLGATFSIPIGNRAARAARSAAETQLVRDRAVLEQAIQNISFTLANMMRDAETTYNQYELALRRVRNSHEWIRAARMRYATPPPGDDMNQSRLLVVLYDYQNALRMHVDATTDAAQLLAKYNTQLVQFEEMQGTLLESRAIELTGDPCILVQEHKSAIFPAHEQKTQIVDLPQAAGPMTSANGGPATTPMPAVSPTYSYRDSEYGRVSNSVEPQQSISTPRPVFAPLQTAGHSLTGP